MTIQFLSLEWIISTFIRAGDWETFAIRIVVACDVFIRGIIFMAVLTGVRSLWAFLVVVSSHVTTLDPLTTIVSTFHFYKRTPSQVSFFRWIFIQMLFKLSKFTLPLTAVLIVGTPNFQLFKRSFEPVVTQKGKVGLVTHWTRPVISLYLLDALATDLLSAGTTDDAWLFQDL